jgi:hypothetical protein
MSKYLALIVFYLLHLYFNFTTRHCSKNVNDDKYNHLKNLVDYIIKSRSESFCAKPRDGRPRRSRGWHLGEA